MRSSPGITHVLSCTTSGCDREWLTYYLLGASPARHRDTCPDCNGSMILDRIWIETDEHEGEPIEFEGGETGLMWKRENAYIGARKLSGLKSLDHHVIDPPRASAVEHTENVEVGVYVKNMAELEERRVIGDLSKSLISPYIEALGTPSRLNPSPGGDRYLTAFTNRWALGFVMLNVAQDVADDDGLVHLDLWCNEFVEVSTGLRAHLDGIEKHFRIGRGEKLSDAFPINEGPVKIALKAWIGCDGDPRDQHVEIVGQGGLLMEVGALQRVSSNQFRIVENGSFWDLPSIKDMLFRLSEPKEIWGESKPYLGVFYPEEIRSLMISNIEANIPDEFFHMMFVLDLIKAEGDEDDGWDSNSYANQELSNILHGHGHRRWEGRYEKYVELGKRKELPNPQEFAADRMVSNINSTLGGLLGRMKELGLIYPIRSGAVKNVQITPFGEKILFEYEGRDE